MGTNLNPHLFDARVFLLVFFGKTEADDRETTLVQLRRMVLDILLSTLAVDRT